MREFITPKIIEHQTTCSRNPQQNKVSEKKNRCILNITRSIMFNMNAPCKFWVETAVCACHLMNRTPSDKLGKKSPIEIIRKKCIKIEHLRVFGCCCYVYLLEDQRNKLKVRATKCIFLGYPYGKMISLVEHVNNKYYYSRDVS